MKMTVDISQGYVGRDENLYFLMMPTEDFEKPRKRSKKTKTFWLRAKSKMLCKLW